MDVLYIVLRRILNLLTTFFFSDIEIVGEKNMPLRGPLIICCNHNNQFVDAILLMRLRRQINFIIAAISTKLTVLRFFLKFTNFVPTDRPMDNAKDGQGQLLNVKGDTLEGKGTNFTTLKMGDQIRTKEPKRKYHIKEVVSDTQVKVENQKDEDLGNCDYFIIPKLDQKHVYEKVVSLLLQNKVIGIFPEGFSHDMHDVQPLKPGACLFVWESKKQLNKNVPILPCSINYFGAHKFRSKVVINVGQPLRFEFEEDKLEDKQYKREKVGQMLEQVRQGIVDTKIQAPDYNTLKDMYIAKEIYLPDEEFYSQEEQFLMMQRLSDSYKKMSDKEEVQNLQKKIEIFRRELKKFNLKVSDLRNYGKTFARDIKNIIWKTFFLTIYLMPFILFFKQVEILIKRIVKKEIQRTIATSSFQTRGNDIVASQVMILSLKFLPIFFLGYSILFFVILKFFCGFSMFVSTRFTLDFLIFFPLYMFLSIKVYDKYLYYLRMIKFRYKMYFYYKDAYKKKIHDFLQERYEIKKQFLNLIKNQKELDEIKNHRIVKNYDLADDQLQQKVENIVHSLSKNFVSII